MKVLLLAALLSPAAQAAPALDPAAKHTPGPSKEAATAPRKLENFWQETKILYESFPGKERTNPLMSSETEQRVRTQKIAPKDGFDRTEMLFQKFKSTTKVQIPGAVKPFVTIQDLGAYLFDKPLVLRFKAGKFDSYENLNGLRDSLTKSVKDPVALQGLKLSLSDEVMKSAAESASTQHSCLEQAKDKAVGAKWEASRSVSGATILTQCEFLGWGEADGKKIQLYKFSLPHQKHERKQPNGAMGVVETEGKGQLLVEPGTGETFVSLETEVFAQPLAKEIEERKKKGEEVPTNKSFVRTTTHAYPI